MTITGAQRSCVTDAPPASWLDDPVLGPPTGPGGSLPVGTVTFLLTDIAGSTRAWEDAAEAMAAAVGRHYELLDTAIASHHGVRPVEQGEGDSVVGAFARASDALAAALDAQRALHAEAWPQDAAVRVRMAVHTGEAELRDEGNYFGPTLNRAARLRAVAHPGQVLVSGATADLVAERLPAEASLVDLGVHRLDDLGRPERVWALRHAELPVVLDAPEGVDAPPSNMPAQLSSFVGRAAELDELRALVATTRLLTLTGVGGCGKTRLALQLAAEVIDRYPAGAWLAELAPVADPDRIPAVVALALGERDVSGDLIEVLVARIGRRPLLAVWDNCEHLLGVAASLADTLLRRCPGLTIVATSREPLGVPGETAWRVPSLALPAQTEPVAVEALSQYDAVRLFLDRATKARPNFRLTVANAPTIAQICHRLDGIPLALELAAARVRARTVEQVAAGLDDRFRLLTGGARTVLPRQQTLQASVDWSYALLTPAEQAAFRRLSVFAVGFTLDAAEHVVADDDLPAVDVLDLLVALVDKSMIGVDDDSGRYRMLETMRQYAAARLVDAGETAAVRNRHLAWVVSREDPMERINVTFEAAAEIEEAVDDYRLALEWALATGRADEARHVAAGLARWELAIGDAGQAVDVCERALAVDGGGERNRLLVTMALLIARVEAGDLDGVDPLRNALLAAVERVDDDALAGRCLLSAGGAIWFYGEERSILWDLSTRAVDAFRRAGRDDLVFAAMGLRATHLAVDGRWREAAQLAAAIPDDAPAAARGNRDRAVMRAAWITGRFDRARQLGLGLPDIRAPRLQASVDGRLAILDAKQGRDSGAAGRLAAELDLARARGVGSADHFGGHRLGAWLLAHGDVDGALRRLKQWKDATPVHFFLRHEGLFVLMEALLAAGDIAAAASELDGCRDTMAEAFAIDRATFRYYDGLVAGALEDPGTAQDALHEALATQHAGGWRPSVVDTLEALAVVAADTESPAETVHLAAAAGTMRADMGYVLRWPYEQRRLDDALAEARAALGEDGFGEAWAEGGRLDDAAVVAFTARGRGGRGRPRAGWASLTPTEADVARLAAEGLSNREIGQRLLMGVETVKTHLSHVYDKTGLHSRTALAHVYRSARNGA